MTKSVEEELKQKLTDMKAKIEDLKEYIEIIEDEESKDKRIQRLKKEKHKKESQIEKLQKKLETFKEKREKVGKVPPELKEEIEDLKENVENLSNRIENFAKEITNALNTVVTIAERGEPEEGETLPPPPDWFENIARRCSDDKFETEKGEVVGTNIPAYVVNEKYTPPQTVPLSWNDFEDYLYNEEAIDKSEAKEKNETAAPVSLDLPPEESHERAEVAEEAAKSMMGALEGYIRHKKFRLEWRDWREISAKEKDVRREVLDWVEDQRPELKSIRVWRAISKVYDENKSVEKNLYRMKKELAERYDMEFPEITERVRKVLGKKEKKEKVEAFVKEWIGKETDKDPENVWNGVKVLYKSTRTLEENKSKMRDVLREQYSIVFKEQYNKGGKQEKREEEKGDLRFLEDY